MPTSGLDYDKHGRPARVKPRKDQDNRSVISSSSSRRHRDSSVSSNRTALPPEGPAQRPGSTSSNLNLDQLPSLSETESGSPSSVSSPTLRTVSKVSTSTTITSPTIPRTSAFLQRFLESESDSPDTEDSQVTPKAEKTKEQCEVTSESSRIIRSKAEPTKIPPTSSGTETIVPTAKVSSESAKAIPGQSPPRVEPLPPSIQETQYRDIHQPAPKHPIPSSLQFAPDQPHLAPMYPYSNIPPTPQAYQSPQLTYLPIPPPLDPNIPQQALGPQGMLYYTDYGPPPPVPEPPYQLQCPPGTTDRHKVENPMAILDRVQHAMPDLHALLESYHHMCGALESREAQIRSMEAQRAAEKQQHEHRFAKLEKEIDMLKKYSTENSHLRREVSNVDKKYKDLQNKLAAAEKSNDRLEALNEHLREDSNAALKKHEKEKSTLTQKYSAEQDMMAADHRAKQRATSDEMQAQTRKAEATLSHREAQLNRSHEEEKHRLETTWGRQRREIEERHAKVKADLEDKLEAKQKVVDEERRTYLQAREGWERERELLMRGWDEEREVTRKASEESYRALTTKHDRERNDIRRQISQTQQHSDKEDSMMKLQKELETVRSGWETDKFRFQQTRADFRSTARTLNEQNNKLQKLTESFGDAPDVKGK